MNVSYPYDYDDDYTEDYTTPTPKEQIGFLRRTNATVASTLDKHAALSWAEQMEELVLVLIQENTKLQAKVNNPRHWKHELNITPAVSGHCPACGMFLPKE